MWKEKQKQSGWLRIFYEGSRPKKGQLVKGWCGYDEVDGFAVIYDVKYVGGGKSQMDLHFSHSGRRLLIEFYYKPKEKMFYIERENTHLELINPD